jgi:hypothetical protein
LKLFLHCWQGLTHGRWGYRHSSLQYFEFLNRTKSSPHLRHVL